MVDGPAMDTLVHAAALYLLATAGLTVFLCLLLMGARLCGEAEDAALQQRQG